jgi:flagellar export protein FliJ
MQLDTLEKLIKLADKKIEEMLRTRRELEDRISMLEQELENSISNLNQEAEVAAADPISSGRDFTSYSKQMMVSIQECQGDIHATEEEVEALQKRIFAEYAEKSKYQNLFEQGRKKLEEEKKRQDVKEMDEIAANIKSQIKYTQQT